MKWLPNLEFIYDPKQGGQWSLACFWSNPLWSSKELQTSFFAMMLCELGVFKRRVRWCNGLRSNVVMYKLERLELIAMILACTWVMWRKWWWRGVEGRCFLLCPLLHFMLYPVTDNHGSLTDRETYKRMNCCSQLCTNIDLYLKGSRVDSCLWEVSTLAPLLEPLHPTLNDGFLGVSDKKCAIQVKSGPS